LGPSQSDQVLVKRCQKGDLAAFEMLVLKYQQNILNLIYHLTSSGEQVEDLAQDVFLKAFKAMKGFRGDSCFYTWLYRIAVNTCRNFMKFQRKRYNYEPLEENPPEPEDIRFHPQDPVHSLEIKELSEEIDRAISSLNTEYRTVIILRDVEGLSYDEIAQVLGCPIGTVRSRLFRARTEMKDKLKAYLV
jgi:RNA polymerase sigma-70 factor (ECF subfamily)